MQHLKINTDKYPKLKWFFNARTDPSAHILYHGALIKSLGGINFERLNRNVNRIHDYVNNVYSPKGEFNKEYEMPYYKWEADLDNHGHDPEYEQTGSFFYGGWRGQYTMRRVPDDDHLSHERMKK